MLIKKIEDDMHAWIADKFSDEENTMVTDGKTVIIRGSKEEIRAITDFVGKVADHLESNDYCHIHLRDSMKNWNKRDHIDIEINVEKESN